jgi:SAM-dependent methyltransferase
LVTDIDIREAATLASKFQAGLSTRKASIAGRNFDWYPFDSFGTVSVFEQVLTGKHRWLRTLIGNEPVLDVGCGDGAVSFFLESLGARVYALDHPATNYNQMRGVAALKASLGSRLRIRSVDVDSQPALALRECGLALLMGILYHLKNPYAILEALSSKARYCLLTTAITRYGTDGQTDLGDLPVAFLAGRDGLRGDETNFWIFTEAGLRILIDRTGWDIRDWRVVDDEDSTLWGKQRDQRVFCLLRSRKRPPVERSQLFSGWHELENGAWRWTERRFSLWLAAPATVTLHCVVPPVIARPITLSGGGVSATFHNSGDHDFVVSSGQGALNFELDRALPPGLDDGRERGIVVRSVDFRPFDPSFSR